MIVGALAQSEKFSTPSHFNDLHTVYSYQKSNWDGSHSSTIFLYILDSNRLESFKWSEGDEWATLVSAWFDWTTCSITRFENHRVFADGRRNLIAELQVFGGNKIHFKVGDFRDSMVLDDKLWQSYDFDFAGLGFSWRALKDKLSPFSFHIADAAFVNNKISFENKGKVQVNFLEKEMINGKHCLKYSIDGPGLLNKGGHIWIDTETSMIIMYRIALPDEQGFENGQLKLLKTEKISPDDWEKFIEEKMKK